MKKELKFNLEIDKIENQDQCQFRLSWGETQKISPILINYPQQLIAQDYLQWQRVYLRYYQKFKPKDREKLKALESNLLHNFNNWLNNEKLFLIPNTISQIIGKLNNNLLNDKIREKNLDSINHINIFLTCNCRELEKLPWERWQLPGISNLIKISFIRSPNNLRSISTKFRHKPARILAIFGDSTGLDFNKENKILFSLKSLIKTLEIISWDENKYKSIEEWRSHICDTIADNQGWDMLFFFGHSEENSSTGGKIGIAPHESISINDFSPYLKKAQNKGLQFALFNSCSGLDIANSLIDLGINQVIIMREQLPDTVAPIFFQEFLIGLAKEKNVSDVLSETCETWRDNINYPSAYLIPSLFGHFSASFYQLKPFGWKAKLKEWLPNRQQTLAIIFLSLVSLFPFVQEFLLDKRLFTQAIYRDLTQQIPDDFSPLITLISIDEDSLIKGNITQRKPLDRKYLATIIERLTNLKAQNISIDYLLDRPQVDNDSILGKSIENAIEKNGTSFIFAAISEGEKEKGILPNIASLNKVMQGSIGVLSNYYIPLPDNCYQSCPFTYLTAVNQQLSKINIDNDNFSLEKDYKTQLLNSFYQTSDKHSELNFLKQVKILPITEISQYFRQHWLQPIIDYSLPPNTIYEIIPAWELLEGDNNKFVDDEAIINNQYLLPNQISLNNQNLAENEKDFPEEKLLENEPNLTNIKLLENQVFLIASGGYQEAGIDKNKDYFSLPWATRFWQKVYDLDMSNRDKIIGGEVNAYMIHHWLRRHLVIPIPDLWLILVVALLANSIEKYLLSFNSNGKKLLLKLPYNNLKFNIFYVLIITNLIYFGLSLQIYITLNLLLPIFLPSLSFWIYFLLRTKNNENS